MRRIKFVSIFLLILIMTIGVCGCDMNNTKNPNNTTNEVVLNDRQKQILSEQGLPTDYQKLSSSQKKSIVAIEDMLRYAESKYDISLVYAGYIEGSTVESEQLRAYPASGDSEKWFTVTNDDDGYKDDYVAIYSEELFISYIQNGIQALCPTQAIKVSAEITYTTLENVPDDGKAFDGTTEATVWLFIDGEGYQEDFETLVGRCEEYFDIHKIYSTVQILLMKADIIKYITNSNFEDYLFDEYYISREVIYIKE